MSYTYTPGFSSEIRSYTGVTSAALDDSGNLIVVYADGTSENLGPITAFAFAKLNGFTGTAQEWTALQASCPEDGQKAATAASEALASKNAAETAKAETLAARDTAVSAADTCTAISGNMEETVASVAANAKNIETINSALDNYSKVQFIDDGKKSIGYYAVPTRNSSFEVSNAAYFAKGINNTGKITSTNSISTDGELSAEGNLTVGGTASMTGIVNAKGGIKALGSIKLVKDDTLDANANSVSAPNLNVSNSGFIDTLSTNNFTVGGGLMNVGGDAAFYKNVNFSGVMSVINNNDTKSVNIYPPLYCQGAVSMAGKVDVASENFYVDGIQIKEFIRTIIKGGDLA